jgi:hypothetical protein
MRGGGFEGLWAAVVVDSQASGSSPILLIRMPRAPLVVVVGAGLSFACASHRVNREANSQPPLVRHLFESRFAEILDRYPLAQAAGADIRRAIELADVNGQAVAIEDYIRTRYKDAQAAYARRKYLALPWYLQDLLHVVSERYTRDPDNLHLLLSRALEFPEVFFLTLNYDTILDRRLSDDSALTRLRHYVAPDRNWKLVKLHGSVNWGYRIDDPEFDGSWITHPPDRLKPVSHDIEMRGVHGASLDSLRHDPDGTFYYPALSVPEGAADEFACPDVHLAYVRDSLRDQRIHFLVLGYSALDQEVLNLLRETGAVIVSGRIVVSGRDDALQVHRRLERGLQSDMRDVLPVNEDFETFVQADGLDSYVEQIRNSVWNPWE